MTSLLFALFLSPASAQPAPVTLRQCYAWAKELSEDLKMRQQEIAQSRARARASLGGAFPRAEWNFTDTYQDPKGVDRLAAQGFGGFVEKNQTESRFTVRQPLFSGFRELSAYSGFKREAARDELRLKRAGDDLFAATADAFYLALAADSDRANAVEALKLADDRIKELQGFRKLGKARASEVYTAQAHSAALQAQLRQAAARTFTAREDLSFLTGKDLSEAALSDELPSPPPVPALDAALAKARMRADVRAQREDVTGRELKVRYERGGYSPSIDVSGNYYTERATFMSAIKWDARLDVRVPLFQGGSVMAKVTEADAALKASRLALEQLERRVQHDVRTAHRDLASAVDETKALETAADAAQKSYDTLKEEYTLGLVTNLEVLQALDLLVAQRSQRDASRLKTKRLALDLAAALEQLP